MILLFFKFQGKNDKKKNHAKSSKTKLSNKDISISMLLWVYNS